MPELSDDERAMIRATNDAGELADVQADTPIARITVTVDVHPGHVRALDPSFLGALTGDTRPYPEVLAHYVGHALADRLVSNTVVVDGLPLYRVGGVAWGEQPEVLEGVNVQEGSG